MDRRVNMRECEEKETHRYGRLVSDVAACCMQRLCTLIIVSRRKGPHSGNHS